MCDKGYQVDLSSGLKNDSPQKSERELDLKSL